MAVTKETTIVEIVRKFPELIEELHTLGLYCFSWGGRPAWGTLELQARMYGIEDIDGLVERLNKKIRISVN